MLILYVGIYIFGITYEDQIYLVLMCGSEYGNILLMLLNSFSGCGIIITISIILSKFVLFDSESKIKRVMIWIGRNTIGIFLVHKPFLQEVVVSTLINLGYSTYSFPVALIASIIVFPISIGIVYVIDKYLPSLFGKKLK